MKNCQKLSTKSYHNESNNSNLIIKVDDIVKYKGRHYMVDSINNDVITGTDMYNNELNFFIDDIEVIIFDSSKQTNILDYIKDNKSETLKNSLIDINTKLKNPMTGLSNIKHLRKLKKNILSQMNELELKNIIDIDLEKTISYKQNNLKIS